MSTLSSTPNTTKNAVLIRIESAVLIKPGCKFDKTATVEIEKGGKKVDFFVQGLDPNKVDFIDPVLKNKFESSKTGTPSAPIWATTYNGDYTDGDIWVPLDPNDKILKVIVKSGQFDGSFDLDVTVDKSPRKDYGLIDKNGHKMIDCSIRISYELGTQYEIDFRTGDPHFTVGTGTEVQILKQGPLGTLFEVIGAGLYKKLKNFNPFGIGHHSTEKSETSIVMFKINGTDTMSRFYQCRNGAKNEIKWDKSERITTSMKFKFFVIQNVGYPLTISIRLVSNIEVNVTWFLEKLILKTIGNINEEFVMPCYQWITYGRMKTISLPYGFLPHVLKCNSQFQKLSLERQNEIEVSKSKYQWDIENVIPSYIRGTTLGSYDLLPLNEKFDDFKNKDFSYLIAKGSQNAALNGLISKFPGNVFDSLDDYETLYRLPISNAITKPVITADNWTDDAFFGWTYLAGTNPMHLTLCKTVPPQFLQQKDLLKDASGNPKNIQEACEQGRLYLVDYTGLLKYNLHTDGVLSHPSIQVGRKYAAPCTCLLYVGDDTKLRPVAIQLVPNGEIYTPSDSKWQWMYAKMAVRNADAQYHQIVDHWLNAHAISETFTIALNRTVSRVHPIFRLLFPHLKYTIAINTLARRGLISPGGYVHQLTSIGELLNNFLIDAYSVLNFSELDLPSRLEKQGFTRENKGALTDFPYMDDGLPVWDAMYEFVSEYLGLYYKSDDDVVNDTELGAFIKELQTKGHPTRPFPDVKSITELRKLLTTIMWTTSCHHSVVNFNQFQMYGFIPNYPLALFQPIPTSKTQIDEKYIMQTLPGVIHSSVQILLLNVLSSYAENEEYLTSNRYMELIGESKAVDCLNKYRNKLMEIDAIIKKRNEERVNKGFYEYTLLIPSNVPNSVAI